MKHSWQKTLLFLTLQVVLVAPLLAEPALQQQLDAMFTEAFPDDAPGAAVVVLRDGQTLLRAGYGLADLEYGAPIDPDTVFRIGSVTKQFTAVAILMLAEEGKLSVDDEITRHLPDYPTHGQKITIEHLLTHTSGVPDYMRIPGFMDDVRDDRTVAEMIALFKDQDLDFEPGSRWSYSNSGYTLLGAIIESVTEQSYGDFVEQRIFEPLGMTRSSYETHETIVPRRARGYDNGEDGFVNARYVSMTIPYAAGSLLSTVDDMARWDAALSTDKLLPRAARVRLWTPYEPVTAGPLLYGYGWIVGEHEGSPVMHHNGSVDGFFAYAVRMPREGIYVAVLANNSSEPGKVMNLTKRAAALASGKPLERQKVEVSNDVLARYAGVYRIGERDTRSLILKDGRLYSKRGPRPPMELVFSSETEFFNPQTLVYGRFELDSAGQATGMTIQSFGMSVSQASRAESSSSSEPGS